MAFINREEIIFVEMDSSIYNESGRQRFDERMARTFHQVKYYLSMMPFDMV
jgi:hypothetical protein